MRNGPTWALWLHLLLLVGSAPSCTWEYDVAGAPFHLVVPGDATEIELVEVARSVAAAHDLDGGGMTPFVAGEVEEQSSAAGLIAAELITSVARCASNETKVSFILWNEIIVQAVLTANFTGGNVVKTVRTAIQSLPKHILEREGCLSKDEQGYICKLHERLEFSMSRAFALWLGDRASPREFLLKAGRPREHRELDVYEDILLKRRQKKRRLICGLKGGLTNQEMILNNCVQIARLYGYDLVRPVPRLYASTPALSEAGVQAEFGRLWDLDHFQSECERLGVAVVDPGDERPTVKFKLDRFSNHAEWTLGGLRLIAPSLKGLYAVYGVIEAATELYLDGNDADLVLESPFNAVTGSLFLDAAPTLLSPAPRIRERAVLLKAELPLVYDCLHARVERDWVIFQCTFGSTVDCDAEEPVFDPAADPASLRPWLNATSGLFFGAHQLAWFLSMRHFNRTLYIATGADEATLKPITSQFDTRTRASMLPNDYFMAYDDALLDREICLGASNFYGSKYSTFSLKVSLIRGDRNETTVWPLDDFPSLVRTHLGERSREEEEEVDSPSEGEL